MIYYHMDILMRKNYVKNIVLQNVLMVKIYGMNQKLHVIQRLFITVKMLLIILMINHNQKQDQELKLGVFHIDDFQKNNMLQNFKKEPLLNVIMIMQFYLQGLYKADQVWEQMLFLQKLYKILQKSIMNNKVILDNPYIKTG